MYRYIYPFVPFQFFIISKCYLVKEIVKYNKEDKLKMYLNF